MFVYIPYSNRFPSRSHAGLAPFSCLVSGPDRALNSAKSFNSYWLACADSGSEGKLCVCPPNNNENRLLIDTANGGKERRNAIEVPLLWDLVSSKF